MTQARKSVERRSIVVKALVLLFLVAFALGAGACQTTSGTTDPQKKSQEDQLLRDAYQRYRSQ